MADFNGRYANPPFLFGGGGVELLAKEMTRDLQQALGAARAAVAGSITPLTTHGVDFGHIETLEGGGVALRVEGIGFEDNAGRRPEDVLVVRPFGRKGENFSMRDFDRVAMRFHFGMQPVEVVGQHRDADGDGVINEVSVADMSALHVFDVTNPVPFVEPLDAAGQRGLVRFVDTGCAGCHVPVLKTRSRLLPLSHPEVPHDPWRNVYATIDLAEVGFETGSGGGRRVRAAVRGPEAARHGRGSGGELRVRGDFQLPSSPRRGCGASRTRRRTCTTDGRACSRRPSRRMAATRGKPGTPSCGCRTARGRNCSPFWAACGRRSIQTGT